MALGFVTDIISTGFFTIFAAPFKNMELLWILIPIYLSFVFAELFQEKTGTSLGNAISNGVVALWAGVDLFRTTVHSMKELSTTTFTINTIICITIFAYGIIIIHQGMQIKEIAKYIGRIREITYMIIMFSPIIYHTVKFDIVFLLSFALFAPIFYFTIELFDKYCPTPQAMIEDLRGEHNV